MAKQETTKEVLMEAEKEIFDGKSLAVKNHFHKLLGKRDGIRVRLDNVVEKLTEELNGVEEMISEFSKMTVDEAYTKTITPVSNESSTDGTWNIVDFRAGYPMIIKSH